MVRSIFSRQGTVGAGNFNVRLTPEEAVAILTGFAVGSVTPEAVVRKVAKLPASEALPDGLFEAVQTSVRTQLHMISKELPAAPPGTPEEQGAFYTSWVAEIARGHTDSHILLYHPKLVGYVPQQARGNSEDSKTCPG